MIVLCGLKLNDEKSQFSIKYRENFISKQDDFI